MQKHLICRLLICIIIAGCSKSDNGDDDIVNNAALFSETCNEIPDHGLTIDIDGDISSEIDPTSQEFLDYITCVQNCAQTNPDDPQCMMDCLISSGLTTSGGAYALSMNISNTTGSDVQYGIFTGTLFIPTSNKYQPMVMAVSTILKFIPDCETVTFKVPVFCLASEKAAPDENSTYNICDVINASGCLEDILSILETKDLYSLSSQQISVIQQTIWNCIEGREVNLEYLNGLPAN